MTPHDAKIIESYKEGGDDFADGKPSQAGLLLPAYKAAYEMGWQEKTQTAALTIAEFNKIPAGTVFRYGLVSDSPTGCNMENTGKLLRFVAKKGFANDWTIYLGLEEWSWDYVTTNGSKTIQESNIRNCVAVDDAVFKNYRY